MIKSSALKIDETSFLSHLTKEVFTQGSTQVLWRHPFSGKKEGIVCPSTQEVPLQALQHIHKRFIIKGFSHMPEDTCLCLKPALYFCLHEHQLSFEKCTRGKVAGHLLFEKRQVATKTPYVRIPPEYLVEPMFAATPQKAYMHTVDKALGAIRQGAMTKVVLARHKYVPYKEHCPVELFMRLCVLYPMAFVYLLCCSRTGVWIGASPEILLHHTPTQAYTHALAGTQKVPRSGSLYRLSWSAKEKREQKIVSQWIRQQLKGLMLDKVQESPRENVRVGDMAHIRSIFSAPLNEKSPSLGVILAALHPTPAICGFPTAQARSFIHTHEHTRRHLYSGFLGPIGFSSNAHAESHLYVNIRCACFMKGSVCLYAGAGIVQGSDPYREWIETEIKCSSLQKVLS